MVLGWRRLWQRLRKYRLGTAVISRENCMRDFSVVLLCLTRAGVLCTSLSAISSATRPPPNVMQMVIEMRAAEQSAHAKHADTRASITRACVIGWRLRHINTHFECLCVCVYMHRRGWGWVWRSIRMWLRPKWWLPNRRHLSLRRRTR